MQFVPLMSPRYMAPTHLAPLLRRFEQAVDGIPQRAVGTEPREAEGNDGNGATHMANERIRPEFAKPESARVASY